MSKHFHQTFLAFFPIWTLTVFVPFALAFFIALATKPKATSPGISLSERNAIKGLTTFSFNDAELFEQLGRKQVIRKMLDSLCNASFHFGILSGESGCGKFLLLQAGIWPHLTARQHQALYVQCNEQQPLESIRYAIHHQFNIPYEQLTLTNMLELAANPHQTAQPETLILMLDQFEQFFIQQSHRKDRQPFILALQEWYRQQPHLVKILVCLRSDLAERMIEVQLALRYSLGTDENFLLDKF